MSAFFSFSGKQKHVSLGDITTFDVSYCSGESQSRGLDHELSECVQQICANCRK